MLGRFSLARTSITSRAGFHGHSAGQGGFTWEFVSAHRAKSEVVSHIKTLPFFTAI